MNEKCYRCGSKLKYGKKYCSYHCMHLPKKERFLNHVKKTATCWLWMGKSFTDFGYGRFNNGGKFGKIEHAHRVSYKLFVGKIMKNKFILHKCDNPKCVNPGHLFIGTQKDNIMDAITKGRFKPGKKFSVEFIKKLRSKFKPGFAVTKLLSFKFPRLL